MRRFFLVGLFVLMAAPLALQAQQARQFVATEKPAAYQAEREFIESTLETIVTILQEATMRSEDSGLGGKLRDVTGKLANAARLMDPTPGQPGGASQQDLDDLRRLLQGIAEQLEAVRETLEQQESYDLADQIIDVERDLRRALREVDRMDTVDEGAAAVSPEDGERWLRPGRYGNDRAARIDERERREDERMRREDERMRREDERMRREDEMKDRHDETDREMRRRIRDRADDHRERKRRRDTFDWRRYSGAFVGGYSFRWPYRRETALYRTAPAIRYNRVEGLMLGLGRRPLAWSSYSRATVYGQGGYAFELKEWRATVGVETRLDNRRNDNYGLKIGGAYRFNTDSRDSWKTSWLENSLAAFFFENDFFDYYQVEGWTVYAVQRITPYLQLSGGYRDEEYRSLDRNTGWSLFKGDGFFENPAIDEGRMHSLVFALEGGQVAGLHSLPRGAAFRIEAEFGDGLGGAFAFNRYIADGRVYLPVTDFSSLSLRLRGGLTTGAFVPLQKQFTLGGIGSVRGYTQNSFLGSRMLLGNAEYIVDDIALFDDIVDFQVIGFVDLGWTNTFGTDQFNADDVLPSAGLGLGLDDRDVRLELAFPLRDFGTGKDPSLWLRITPSF